jgi:hypothetical protein
MPCARGLIVKMNRKQRRALANQNNARLSTGPRTEEGKAQSSRNATSHGLAASDPVLAHEDRATYERLRNSLRGEFRPAGDHQEFLVDQMVDARWRLARIRRFEAAYFDICAQMTDAESEGPEHRIVRTMMGRRGDPLAIFRRHETALEATYHRCCKELREARKEAADRVKAHSMQSAASRTAEINGYLARELAMMERESRIIQDSLDRSRRVVEGKEEALGAGTTEAA